jgi:hypothetical protein
MGCEWPEIRSRARSASCVRMMQDTPLEDKVKAAEDWLRVYEAHPASWRRT